MSKKRIIASAICLVLATALTLIVLLTSHLAPRPEILAKRLQKSIVKLDAQFNEILKSDFDEGRLAEMGIGMVVFEGDSLIRWNSNEVEPRFIKRRIRAGNDTICNLLSGDYYVKSFTEAKKTYYLFKLVNSTYKIENQFFENRYWLLPNFINARISFNVKEGYALSNQEGKTVGICQITNKPSIKQKQVVIMLSIAGILFLLAVLAILLSSKKIRKRFAATDSTKAPLKWGIVTFTIILLSIIATVVYNKSQTEKEEAFMKLAAANLHEGRNKDFEDDYYIFYHAVQHDSLLRAMVFEESNVLAEVVLGYTRDLLFPKSMKEYNVMLTICAPGDELTIHGENEVCDCEDYFLEKLDVKKKNIIGNGLFYLDNNTLEPNYFAKIKIFSADSTRLKTMYFDFTKPVVPEGFGFPRLLQEKNSKKPYDYSIANYSKDTLVYKYGDFLYPNFLKDLNHSNQKITYDKTNKHYTLAYGDNNTLIISTAKKKWPDRTAPFAVFFLLLTIPVILFIICCPRSERIWKGSFSKKLQWIVVFSLFGSFLVIGPISVLYMNRLYNQKNANAQFEKTKSIVLDMKSDYDVEWLKKHMTKSTLDELLQQYSGIFYTELNLYDLDGRLMATSRREIFENNLQAPLMNPVAFAKLHDSHAFYFTHEEHLGKGAYESAYMPLSDNYGNVLAYVNTPYFSSKVDLQKEISSFVLNYMNINIVMLCIAIFIVIVVTTRLNKPLNLIQEKMRNVELDKNNEPINWKSKDEIGVLIEQYNQLIVKLEQSANLIARNERESTWREMARQVAHEIKNPLTPMQLSVQYLVKAYNEGSEDIGERLKRTANTLLEQIEALSEIASAFSNFAKLPENHPEPIDLAELLQSVVNLYDVETNIRFTYTFDEKKTYEFDGDKTNLNRAFGNIVKNAVQAIGDKAEGHIKVHLENQNQKYVITISDNGKGIKEEDKKKIFLPNFTTKSSGTGLGLAMVYNIVQVAGGRINFESEEGQGTSFIVELFKS